jgi:molecular chaperone GrpE
VTEQHNGEPERVVVRDRRRIDPVTGEARVPAGEESAGAEPGTTAGQAPRGDDVSAQLEERTADLQRITAEYANYRRRVERDREAVVTAAKAHVVGELVGVLDDLERAESHGDLTGAFKAVADKLVGTLHSLGLEAFGAEGEPFDPAVHEAVHHDTSPDVSGPTVAAVLRRGYRLRDRLLRPAMVAVADRALEPDAQPGDLPPTADPFNPGGRGGTGRTDTAGVSEQTEPTD